MFDLKSSELKIIKSSGIDESSSSQPVAKMVERFVKSLATANDSGTFESSFEVKTLNGSQRKKSKCITELDRESIMRFVQDFEERNKTLLPLSAKKRLYRVSSPTKEMDSDLGSSENDECLRTPSPRRRISVLQFFSSKKKERRTSDCSSYRSKTPSPRFSQITPPKPLADWSEDEDDGISSSSTYSRNLSPDSSFEMQPPIIPTFKITPPKDSKFSRNPAYELARIIRGSFHVKKASVATLRRSISDPDHYKVEKDPENPNKFVIGKTVKKQSTLGAAVVRNLDLIRSRALPSNSSPFKRWGQSSFRAPRVTEPLQSLTRRPSSLVASENDVYTKSMDAMMIDGLTPLENSTKCANRKISAPCRTLNGNSNTVDIEGGGGVLTWGTSFEKLLEDPAGMNTFAEFLKKEYSAENIYFWAACERYRQIDNDSERQKQAVEIFSKHLSNGAMEPVNVDSHARNFAQQNLNGADRTLFNLAQKQIFHLMKFDSYQRFIRSDLYKKCLDCYQKKLHLPYPGEQLDELLRTGNEIPGPPKLKKSASNAEDRRRKSLLPWHRKTRCKSRDRTEPPIIELQKSKSSTAIKSTFGNTLKLPNSGSSDIHSSRSSLSSFDTNFQEEHQRKISISNGACTLCKVILSDGATTVVQTNATETVRQLVERLLEKRGLNYSFYDVYIRDTNQLVNLQESSAILAKNTVYVEQIVAFKLVLPNSKHISVKCKPKKVLSEVLTPILHKYNYRMEDVVKIVIKDSQKELELSVPVTNVDGHRLQVHMTKMLQSNGVGAGGVPQQPQHTLDEITNKVFNELLKEKVDNNGNSHQGMDQGLAGTTEVDNQSMKSEDCISESSSLFDRIRRKDTTNIPVLRSNRQKKVVISNNHKLVISASEELNGNHIPVEKISEPLPTPPAPLSSSSSLTTTGTATGLATGTPSMSSTAANQKPLIAKWKTGAKLQCTERTEKQGEEFIEGLKRAQKARLEDQRGVEINFELPDFLKNNENISAANKLRKIRANLSPISRQQSTESTKSTNNPVPAPRLSLTKATMPTILDLTAIEKTTTATPVLPTVPPPLPPKPKVLPAKPSNWGQNTSNSSTNSNISLLSTASSASNSSNSSSSSSSGPVISNSPSSTTKILNDIKRHQAEQQNGSAYLDQPSSSFV